MKLYTDSTTSKLTIAKDRCTIKIAKKDKEIGTRIIDFANKIYDTIAPVHNTNRGQFEVVNGLFEIKLTKFKANKEVTYTFSEGEF